MSDRLEDFDYTAERFLRHKGQPHISFSDYFETKTTEFAKSFDGRRKISLDTMFWIKLRNAAVRGAQADPLDQTLLSRLRESVSDGRAVCPFSTPLWYETFHQSDPVTRVATARLIDELSARLTCLSEEDRIAMEVAELFTTFVLKETPREPAQNLIWSVPVCGLGIPFIESKEWFEQDAEAVQKTLLDEIWSTGFAAIIENARDLSAAMKATLASMAAEMNAFRNTHTPAGTFEEEHAREFVGALRSKRRTMTQAIELTLRRRFGSAASNDPAFYEKLAETFSIKILESFLSGSLGNALPPLVVPTALHAAVGRDSSRIVSANDHHDFGHATIAIPYCDCFATERSLAHLVDAQLKLARQFETTVITSSEDLITFVESLPPASTG